MSGQGGTPNYLRSPVFLFPIFISFAAVVVLNQFSTTLQSYLDTRKNTLFQMESSKGIVLVTGGAGFIGSHTLVELLEANYSVVVVDNLHNSSEEALNRVEKITGTNDSGS